MVIIDDPHEHKASASTNDEVDQRIAWRHRLAEAILKRQFDDETLLAMLDAGLSQAHAEGLLDAAEICKGVASVPANRRVASALERAMRNLIELNKKTRAEVEHPTGIEPVSSP